MLHRKSFQPIQRRKFIKNVSSAVLTETTVARPGPDQALYEAEQMLQLGPNVPRLNIPMGTDGGPPRTWSMSSFGSDCSSVSSTQGAGGFWHALPLDHPRYLIGFSFLGSPPRGWCFGQRWEGTFDSVGGGRDLGAPVLKAPEDK